jgi:hypothetical protein
MNRSVIAIGLLAMALGFAASTPALADFAVVQFGNGHCQIWRDSESNPWGADWRKIAIGLPSWSAAAAVLDTARAQDVCP